MNIIWTIVVAAPVLAAIWLILTYLAREAKKEDDRDKFIDQLIKDKQS